MDDRAEPIADFWRWWVATGREQVAASVEGDGLGDDLIEEIGRRLDAIALDLAWEIGAGRRAPNALVISAGGDPELRAVAYRIHRAAPEAGDGFEYHPARQADPSSLDHVIALEGDELDLGELRVAASVDEDREEVDVAIHHPRFAEVPEQVRGQVAFLALDWLLGEEEVERWIGDIETPDAAPADARPFPELARVVDGVRQLGGSEPRGVLLEYEDGDGRPVIVSAERPLKPVDRPLLDTHVALRTPFEPVRDDGWPAPDALDWLRDREDELLGAVGDGAFLAAHETAGGVRTFHLYVDGASDAEERVRGYAERALPAGAEVAVAHDPAWEAIRPFR